jgi:hypothetical protein
VPRPAADPGSGRAGLAWRAAGIINYDGTVNQGAIFLVNDSDFVPTDANYPAALAGWAANGHVPSGIYGYTAVAGGDGVVGATGADGAGNGVHGVADAAGAVGVFGENKLGTAISGTSADTEAYAAAIVGTISSTTPGGYSAGVRGVNNGTAGNGIGVYGSHAGGGWGVYGSSESGAGVFASSSTGPAVEAFGATGVVANGTTAVLAEGGTTGVSATGKTAVHAAGTVAGVTASGPTGVQASGTGTKGVGVAAAGVTAVDGAGTSVGRGGVFSGGAAQVQLTPGTGASHPKAGETGDLYVDKSARLWFCRKGGASATWHQIA